MNVGQRVRFYGMGLFGHSFRSGYCNDICVVRILDYHVDDELTGMIKVRNEISNRDYIVHVKQCRKIKERK